MADGARVLLRHSTTVTLRQNRGQRGARAGGGAAAQHNIDAGGGAAAQHNIDGPGPGWRTVNTAARIPKIEACSTKRNHTQERQSPTTLPHTARERAHCAASGQADGRAGLVGGWTKRARGRVRCGAHAMAGTCAPHGSERDGSVSSGTRVPTECQVAETAAALPALPPLQRQGRWRCGGGGGDGLFRGRGHH
jgi:hypothetical protein